MWFMMMWFRLVRAKPAFTCQSSPSSPSWGEERIRLCQLFTIELSVAELESPGLWQLRALKWWFPESRPNIPPCSAASQWAQKTSGGSGSSAALCWREGEDKRPPFSFPRRPPDVWLSPSVPTSLPAFEERCRVWKRGALSRAWQRCPRGSLELRFHPLSSEVRLNSSGENAEARSEGWKNASKWGLTKTVAATT